MEFGPRAWGSRSILADPRDVRNVDRLNSVVKRREGFRPFAPAVLAERADQWFRIDRDAPYMTVTAPVIGADPDPTPASDRASTFAERLEAVCSDIPACTHVDMSARVQTVDADVHPLFHALLSAFGRRSGCPVLVNTSFNRAGEPIVRSPADAVRCFSEGGLDLLVIERCVIEASAVAA